ncbi:alpha/beta hydrolase [Paenochrobactrum glaciei]|uniref:Alpha/beta hydrolase n=1 Tax=Paenochrobactrum glaciei TaxID=486407 RepID=A0ABN1GLA2_9HYPH
MAFEEAKSAGVNYLERKGSGTVVVCLHGIGSNASSFEVLLPYLPDNWRVIAWNAPGYAGSEPLVEEWPLALNYAQALKAFLDRLGVKKCHIFGHSLGTLMASSFAKLYPDMVDKLILASCALGHGVKVGSQLSEQAKARLDDLDNLGADAFAKARAGNLVYQPEKNPQLVERVYQTMRTVSNPGYSQAVHMLASGQLLKDCEHLNVPVSVIVGAQDQITPLDNNGQVWSVVKKHSRHGFVSVPDAGHALYQQAPEAVAQFMIRELEQRNV